jgi:hypothetical protein
MKVRICFTGEIKHVPVDSATASLLRLGIIEEVKEPLKPVEVRWFLYKSEGNISEHALAFKCGGQLPGHECGCDSTSYFVPDVNLGAAKIAELVRPFCAHATPCPMELINQYIWAGGGTPIPKWDTAPQPAPQISASVQELINTGRAR